MTSVLRRDVLLSSHLMPTTGDMKFGFTNFDHIGWLLCDGRTLNKSDYHRLYYMIGDTYTPQDQRGGATFKLPDMRGRVPGAASKDGTGLLDDNGAALSTRTKGQVIGEERHTLSIGEMPAHKHGDTDVTGNANGNGNTTSAGEHTHTATDAGHDHAYVRSKDSTSTVLGSAIGPSVNDDVFGSTTDPGTANITVESAGAHIHTIKSTGGSQSHNNMQPTLFIGNMFIYSGEFKKGSRRGDFPSEPI